MSMPLRRKTRMPVNLFAEMGALPGSIQPLASS